MRRATIAAGVFGVAACIAMSVPVAIAAPSPAGEPASLVVPGAGKQEPVGIQGIGQQVTVKDGIIQSDMKPIPGTDAPNTGLGRPGDNIAAICYLDDSRGLPWVLGLNRNGRAGEQFSNTVGFIRVSDLVAPGQPVRVHHCTNIDVVDHGATIRSDTGIVQSDMKPIAGTDAPNTGLARPGDALNVYCYLPDNHGTLWQIVINTNGRAGQQFANTVGFVRFSDTNDSVLSVNCGAS